MTQGPPAWHADPSGRHQYRWWDGLGYTDQVADGGVVSTDPHATPLTSSVPDRPGRSIALVVAAFVAVGVLGAAVALLVGRGGGTSGTGTFAGVIDGDDVAGVHRVRLGAGTALTIELDPDRGLDAVVGLVVARADARRIEDLYDEIGGPAQSLSEAFAVDVDLDGQVVFRTDVGFAGDEEQVLLVVPFDLEVLVVVAPFDPSFDSEGEYELTIEAFGLDTDDDDIDDLLEAVVEDRRIPRGFRELAEQQLALS